MRSAACSRGVTLIEVMFALAILLVAASGMVGIHNQGVQMMADARQMTRATGIASDLVEQIESWGYTDGRLVDGNPGNNGELGDHGQFLAQALTYAGEYAEANLAAGPWYGIPTASLPAGYERYWNVADDDLDGNGTVDVKRIAVVVRWPHGNGFRRVVLVTSKLNPAVYR